MNFEQMVARRRAAKERNRIMAKRFKKQRTEMNKAIHRIRALRNSLLLQIARTQLAIDRVDLAMNLLFGPKSKQTKSPIGPVQSVGRGKKV